MISVILVNSCHDDGDCVIRRSLAPEYHLKKLMNEIFEHCREPGIIRFAQYCIDLAGDDPLPRRSQFRPTRVSSIMGYLFLIDVLADDNDYFFSLFGTHMSILYGEDLTGKRLSQIGDANLQGFLRSTYDRVVATRKPLYLRGRYAWDDRSVDIERLLMPMTDDNGKLTTIFGVAIPDVPAETLLVFAGQGAAKLVTDQTVAAE